MSKWQRFLCNVLGWHRPKIDGTASLGYDPLVVCRRCGRVIYQDSQGNWF